MYDVWTYSISTHFVHPPLRLFACVSGAWFTLTCITFTIGCSNLMCFAIELLHWLSAESVSSLYLRYFFHVKWRYSGAGTLGNCYSCRDTICFSHSWSSSRSCRFCTRSLFCKLLQVSFFLLWMWFISSLVVLVFTSVRPSGPWLLVQLQGVVNLFQWDTLI